MRTDRVQEDVEVTIECKMDDVIDLSVDIAWTPIEMDGEAESNDEDKEGKDVEDPSRTLSFREKMKKISLNCLPLKEWMKDRSISYVDLLHLDPYPTRVDEDRVPVVSRRLALGKNKR